MLKVFGGFVGGLLLTAIVSYLLMPSMMFKETPSPFGMEETIARIQHNIEDSPELKAKGWSLSGLRAPFKPMAAMYCRFR
jgi:hypothetical protein